MEISIVEARELFHLSGDQLRGKGNYPRKARMWAISHHYDMKVDDDYTCKDLLDDANAHSLVPEGSSYDSFRQRLIAYRKSIDANVTEAHQVRECVAIMLARLGIVSEGVNKPVEWMVNTNKRWYRSMVRKMERDMEETFTKEVIKYSSDYLRNTL